MTRPRLALDFGGTKHTAAIILPGETSWRALLRAPAGAQPSAERDLSIMLGLARNLLDDEPPEAIGVSFGGPVDSAGGVVRLSHHVPGWEDFPLAAILRREFGVPVVVDNDANAAALGEHCFGAGRGAGSLCYITVSTGVGGGWVLAGRIWRGVDGMAGEIGHTVVDPNGPLCLCGKRGCVERYASGPYIAQHARELLGLHPASGAELRRLSEGDAMRITGRMVAEAAEQGDELAQQSLTRAAWALGVGIGNAANLLNPARFVLGGGVTHSGNTFWDLLRRSARETALPQVTLEIVPAALGDDAPLWGALALIEIEVTP